LARRNFNILDQNIRLEHRLAEDPASRERPDQPFVVETERRGKVAKFSGAKAE
jgi:hypothetical protein